MQTITREHSQVKLLYMQRRAYLQIYVLKIFVGVHFAHIRASIWYDAAQHRTNSLNIRAISCLIFCSLYACHIAHKLLLTILSSSYMHKYVRRQCVNGGALNSTSNIYIGVVPISLYWYKRFNFFLRFLHGWPRMWNGFFLAKISDGFIFKYNKCIWYLNIVKCVCVYV